MGERHNLRYTWDDPIFRRVCLRSLRKLNVIEILYT